MQRIGVILGRGVLSLAGSVQFWLGLAVVVFGMWAFGEQWCAAHHLDPAHPQFGDDEIKSVDEIAYKTMQLFTMQTGVEEQSSWALVAARVFACLFFISTAGKVLSAIFHDSLEFSRRKLLFNHSIVCGYGRIGARLVDDLLEATGYNRLWLKIVKWLTPTVVAIECDKSHEGISKAQRNGALVVFGDATNEALLKSIDVVHADRIFAVTGNDSANIEIAFDCINLLGKQAPDRELSCFVQLSDPTIRKVFRTRAEAAAAGTAIKIRDFNPASNSGRDLIRRTLHEHRPKLDSETAMYVFIGFGKSGQSIALEFAELAHFENRKRPRMLIVEENCQSVASRFTSQFGAFTHESCLIEDYDDVAYDSSNDDWGSRDLRPRRIHQVAEPGVEYVANALFIERPEHFSDGRFIDMLHRVTHLPNVKPIIVVCSENDRENFEVAGVLADSLETMSPSPLPIFTWLPTHAAFHSALEKEDASQSNSVAAADSSSRMCRLMSFGNCAETSSLSAIDDRKTELLAARILEAYENLDKLRKEQPEATFDALMGQIRQQMKPKEQVLNDWDAVGESEREWNIRPAMHAFIKRAVADEKNLDQNKQPLDKKVVGVLAEMEHNRWMAERLLTGWRYNETRCDRSRQRENMLSWSDLPDAEREKDFVLARITLLVDSEN